jgi:hypothetical protein
VDVGKRVVSRWMLSQSHLWRRFVSPQRNPSGGPFPHLPFLAVPRFLPHTLGRPFPSPLGWPPSPPMEAPLHDFLLPLDLPPRSKDREEEEHVELKRERGSRRCSSPSLLEDFLGVDEIFVPPYKYVLLEVVDHGD